VTLFLLSGLFLLLTPKTATANDGDEDGAEKPLYLKMAEKAKLKGDLRLRFDTQQRDTGSDTMDRRRWRYASACT